MQHGTNMGMQVKYVFMYIYCNACVDCCHVVAMGTSYARRFVWMIAPLHIIILTQIFPSAKANQTSLK